MGFRDCRTYETCLRPEECSNLNKNGKMKADDNAHIVASPNINHFETLPQDIIEILLLYLDIPSIASLCQTSKPQPSNNNISQLTSTEKIWLRIVNHRFNLFSTSRMKKYHSRCGQKSLRPTGYAFEHASMYVSNMPRPKLYGGSTWKEAYRNMARCNRMPKLKVNFKRKSIFAKGGGYKNDDVPALQSLRFLENDRKKPASAAVAAGNGGKLKDNPGTICGKPMITDKDIGFIKGNHHTSNGTPLSKAARKAQSHLKSLSQRRQKKYSQQFVACWVMINHTEDCNLRTTTPDRFYERYVDHGHLGDEHGILHRQLDAHRVEPFIELQVAIQNTKSGFCNVDVNVHNTTVQMQDHTGIATQRIVRHGILGPKVIYRSEGTDVNTNHQYIYADMDGKHDHNNSDEESGVLSLKPFEFVIISVCVPLTHYVRNGGNEVLRYETDFLSRALSICVPVSCRMTEWQMVLENVDGRGYHDPELREYLRTGDHSTVAVATFASEHEIWENYMELPGGCLILVDKRD